MTSFGRALRATSKQIRQHVTNVEQVFDIFGEQPHEEECVGFEGLKKEHDELMQKTSSFTRRLRRPRRRSAHRELRNRRLRRAQADGEGTWRGSRRRAPRSEPCRRERGTPRGREDRDAGQQRVRGQASHLGKEVCPRWTTNRTRPTRRTMKISPATSASTLMRRRGALGLSLSTLMSTSGRHSPV